MKSARLRATRISAVVSDVDGTLVTDDKRLTARALAAVAELRARGIIFTIISSRPPRGLRMLIDRLEITTPVGCFNGAVIAAPDLAVLTAHLLASESARRAVAMLDARGVQSWVFAGQDWLLRGSGGPYVGLEQRTVGFAPTPVADFDAALDVAAKIVGSSADVALLARCESDIGAALAGRATVVRSQPYYLDITDLHANKGIALTELSRLLAIPPAEIAVIGDAGNDVAMFQRSGFSIAMGNASPEVQREADVVTGANSEEGFADAITRFIIGGDRPSRTVDAVREGYRPW